MKMYGFVKLKILWMLQLFMHSASIIAHTFACGGPKAYELSRYLLLFC